MRVVGLMSGTSVDAIDAAIADITLEGETVSLHPLGSVRALYDDDLREEILAALPPAPTTMQAVCRLDTRIGQAFGLPVASNPRILAGSLSAGRPPPHRVGGPRIWACCQGAMVK